MADGIKISELTESPTIEDEQFFAVSDGIATTKVAYSTIKNDLIDYSEELAEVISPTVTPTPIEGGHMLTIVDINGTTTFDVMDGETGPQGPQGIPGPQGPTGTFEDLTTAQVQELASYVVDSTCIRAFDTVADMQAAVDLQAGMVCHTNGFHASGDGGAAYYTISASGTANGVTVFACANSLFATKVNDQFKFINVLEYGADPTGTTDSSAAFQAAFNVAAQNRSQGVYVGSGNYLIENTVYVNCGLGIIGNPTMYPCEFANPVDMPSPNSGITINCAIGFDVIGYQMGSYTFAPIDIENVTIAGTNRTESAIVYRASGGSTRPSLMKSCKFIRLKNLIEFIPATDSPQLDCLDVFSCVFRNLDYIFYAASRGVCSASFIGCVIDNAFGFRTYKAHGCIKFENTIIEQATGTIDSDAYFDISGGGAVVFDGCYFEALHGSMVVKGTTEASRVKSYFTIRDTHNYGGANFSIDVTECYVDMQLVPGIQPKLSGCILKSNLLETIKKGSSFLTHGYPASNPTQSSPSSTVSVYIGPFPTYTRVNLHDCTFTLTEESDVVLYAVKQRAAAYLHIYDSADTSYENDLANSIALPYEQGLWVCILANPLPAGTYVIHDLTGGVPNIYAVAHSTDTGIDYKRAVGLL